MGQTVVGRKIWQPKKPGQPGSQYTWLQAVEAAVAEIGLFPDAGKGGEFQLTAQGKGKKAEEIAWHSSGGK